MALILTDDQNYKDIAAAIREKNGGTTTYAPGEMAAAISAGKTLQDSQLVETIVDATQIMEYQFYPKAV